jgi:hypothetical protein
MCQGMNRGLPPSRIDRSLDRSIVRYRWAWLGLPVCVCVCSNESQRINGSRDLGSAQVSPMTSTRRFFWASCLLRRALIWPGSCKGLRFSSSMAIDPSISRSIGRMKGAHPQQQPQSD